MYLHLNLKGKEKLFSFHSSELKSYNPFNSVINNIYRKNEKSFSLTIIFEQGRQKVG